MNALLDAMKKSNGGAQGEIGAAMARLEKAFEQVREVVLDGTPKMQEPVLPEVKVSEPEPVHVNQRPAVAEPVMETVKEEAIPQTPPSEPIDPVQAAAVSNLPRRSSVKENLQQSSAVKAVDPANESGLHSVAKEKQLQDLLRTNRQKEAITQKQQEEERVAAMDPLQAPDVSSGLSQLLSEWGLFKSSGIFGTGPSGKDHPLYQKIAPLTMAAVIAGRFEGATTPIKQSITDYMNGWRYEEGITHEHGETFEHYLRRVVRHILNKQKRNQG